ncbi:alpha/beta hydrolase family protein [Paenibacillus dokdonensis]|uniref:alpha/beta hydrolase family protein n=1 Tax=Paenibacillus dokdonensis TaxID=2567944 RepID=UPI0010A8ADB1|nr:alpha/beta hydrolase [Paenibacillus dokdonensis]
MNESLIIGRGTKYPLNGILSLPDPCSSKVPAVVLVHGSGPLDKDESIGANKPFRDVAEALSAKGIAVLRYDKRTKIYGKRMLKESPGDVTVESETIEDAILAAKLLKNDGRIDPDKVYIFGHSLGGMLAPRIDMEGGNFAGIIIGAGSPRSLSDIIMSQNDDVLAQLPKFLRKIAKRQIAGLKAKFDAITGMSEEEAKQTKVFGKIYAWYFKEMAGHPAADYLIATEKPVLILQGDKDFQVSSEKDFALYQQICIGKPNVRFKLYPGLNHLFMKSVYGRVKDFKKEYKIPQKVSAEVLEDIAEWVLAK